MRPRPGKDSSSDSDDESSKTEDVRDAQVLEYRDVNNPKKKTTRDKKKH